MMTPKLVWRRIQKGVEKRVLADPPALMRQFHVGEVPGQEDISVPGFALRVADLGVDQASRNAQRSWDACLVEWARQGHKNGSRAFYDAVFRYCLIPLFAEEESKVQKQLKTLRDRTLARMNSVTGKSVGRRKNTQRKTAIGVPIKDRLDEIDRAAMRYRAGIALLRRGWGRKIEVRKRDCDLRARQRRAAQKRGAIKAPGPKVTADMKRFRLLAGKLWRKKQDESRLAHEKKRRNGVQPKKTYRPRVTLQQLKEIASKLDDAGFTPPHKYLEGKELRTSVSSRNSRSGNSKTKQISGETPALGLIKPAPVLSWMDIATGSDRTLIKAMRTVLSRCAGLNPRN